jgi:hypothetical protein
VYIPPGDKSLTSPGEVQAENATPAKLFKSGKLFLERGSGGGFITWGDVGELGPGTPPNCPRESDLFITRRSYS